MKRARIATGVLTATLLATAMPAAAFAMPGDIEEAVTQQGYNAYEYQSSDAAYDDPSCWRSRATMWPPRTR